MTGFGVRINNFVVVYRSIFTGFTISIKVSKDFIWACLGMPDHTSLNLHDKFITLIDMKLHAQNQL